MDESSSPCKVPVPISRNTLDHLKREGLPKLVQSIEPLMEQVYPDREAFLTALAELEVLPCSPGDRCDPSLFCNGPTRLARKPSPATRYPESIKETQGKFLVKTSSSLRQNCGCW